MKSSTLEMKAPIKCFMRSVSQSFSRSLQMAPAAIDVQRAAQQHKDLVSLLASLVDEIQLIEVSEEHPDGCFVEDTALLIGDLAVMTRPGAQTRRGEVGQVEAVLAESMQVAHLEAGSLDGGDVMRCGNTFFVGQSSRTNEAGLDSLRAICTPLGMSCVGVCVSGGLHLKSVCTMVDEATMVALMPFIDKGFFEEHGIRVLEVQEPEGANVLPVGEVVLVSAAAPKTQALLEREGFKTRGVDVSELHKADGALTCLSLRRAHAGAWCA